MKKTNSMFQILLVIKKINKKIKMKKKIIITIFKNKKNCINMKYQNVKFVTKSNPKISNWSEKEQEVIFAKHMIKNDDWFDYLIKFINN